MTNELQKWIDRLQEASGSISSRIQGHRLGGQECEELSILLINVKNYIEAHHISEKEVLHNKEEISS